jgi:hypothetical protein
VEWRTGRLDWPHLAFRPVPFYGPDRADWPGDEIRDSHRLCRRGERPARRMQKQSVEGKQLVDRQRLLAGKALRVSRDAERNASSPRQHGSRSWHLTCDSRTEATRPLERDHTDAAARCSQACFGDWERQRI